MKVKLNSVTTYFEVVDDDGGNFIVASFRSIDKTIWKAMTRDENDRQMFVDPEKEKQLIDGVKITELPYDEGTGKLMCSVCGSEEVVAESYGENKKYYCEKHCINGEEVRTNEKS